MTCKTYGNLTICSPGEVKTIAEESVGIKWCFICRSRVQFTDVLKGEIGPSYYGPWWSRICSAGHLDGDLFPGRYREYE